MMIDMAHVERILTAQVAALDNLRTNDRKARLWAVEDLTALLDDVRETVATDEATRPARQAVAVAK